MKSAYSLTDDEKLELEEIRQEIEEQNPRFTKGGIVTLAWCEFLQRNADKNFDLAVEEINNNKR